MTGTRNRTLRKLAAALLAATLAATALSLTAQPAAAHKGNPHVPHTGDQENNRPYWYNSFWSKGPHTCGIFGCRDDFLTSEQRGARALWYMGDIQGKFKLSIAETDHFTKKKIKPSGRVQWSIWERRIDGTRYQLRWKGTISQTGKHDWRTFKNPAELDGRVIVQARALDEGKWVGVRGVKLRHFGILPEHSSIATEQCTKERALKSREYYRGHGPSDKELTTDLLSAFVDGLTAAGAGGAAGSAVPGVGTIAGAVVGFVAGFTVSFGTTYLTSGAYNWGNYPEGSLEDLMEHYWQECIDDKGYMKHAQLVAELSADNGTRLTKLTNSMPPDAGNACYYARPMVKYAPVRRSADGRSYESHAGDEHCPELR